MRAMVFKDLDLVGFVAVVANTGFRNGTFPGDLLGQRNRQVVAGRHTSQNLCVYGILRVLTEPIANVLWPAGETKMMLHATALAGAVSCC